MDKETKIQQVKDLEEKVQKSQAVIFTDYRGLNVEQISKLRNELRELGTEYHVVKNTLLCRAITGVEITEDQNGQLFIGPTAVAFSDGDPVNTAKIIKNFAGDNEALEIKGGLLGNTVMEKEQVVKLAALPAREILLAQLLAGMQSPITGFVRSLSGILQNFVMTLEAIKQQKSE